MHVKTSVRARRSHVTPDSLVTCCKVPAGISGAVEGANGAFYGVLLGEDAIFAANRFTRIGFLWYNVIGCLVVVAAGVAISAMAPHDVSVARR